MGASGAPGAAGQGWFVCSDLLLVCEDKILLKNLFRLSNGPFLKCNVP